MKAKPQRLSVECFEDRIVPAPRPFAPTNQASPVAADAVNRLKAAKP